MAILNQFIVFLIVSILVLLLVFFPNDAKDSVNIYLNHCLKKCLYMWTFMFTTFLVVSFYSFVLNLWNATHETNKQESNDENDGSSSPEAEVYHDFPEINTPVSSGKNNSHPKAKARSTLHRPRKSRMFSTMLRDNVGQKDTIPEGTATAGDVDHSPEPCHNRMDNTERFKSSACLQLQLAGDNFNFNNTLDLEEDEPDLKLTLHQFPRGVTIPCLICDGMCLETFVRLLQISCEVELNCLDPTGPYITWGEEASKVVGIKDCTAFLKTKYAKKSQTILVQSSERDKAKNDILILDHLAWCLRSWTWLIEDGDELKKNQPHWDAIWKNFSESRKAVEQQINKIGFGHKSYEERCYDILMAFYHLSLSLGEKLFFLGDAPTELDCTAFSLLSQVAYGHESLIGGCLKKYPNLMAYCERMKQGYWPDWEDHLGHMPMTNAQTSGTKVESTLSESDVSQFPREYYRLSTIVDDETETEDKTASTRVEKQFNKTEAIIH